MIEFVHSRLIAYQVAKEFAKVAHEIAREFPRGEGDLADQLRRAAASMVLNVAEGAGRRAGKEKARFFEVACGSGMECAAVLDLAEAFGIASWLTIADARRVLHRAVGLAAGLARSARRRAG